MENELTCAVGFLRIFGMNLKVNLPFIEVLHIFCQRFTEVGEKWIVFQVRK